MLLATILLSALRIKTFYSVKIQILFSGSCWIMNFIAIIFSLHIYTKPFVWAKYKKKYHILLYQFVSKFSRAGIDWSETWESILLKAAMNGQ